MKQIITLKGRASQVFRYWDLLIKAKGNKTLGELSKEVRVENRNQTQSY